MKDVEEDGLVMFQKRFAKIKCWFLLTSNTLQQVLLDSLPRALRSAADQRAARILGRFSASSDLCCLLATLHHRDKHRMAHKRGTLHLGIGQKPQAVRLQHGVHRYQEVNESFRLE